MDKTRFTLLAGLIAAISSARPPHRFDARVAAIVANLTTLQKAKQLDMYYGSSQLLTNGTLDFAKVDAALGADGIGVVHDLYDPMTGGRSIINQLQAYILNSTGPKIPIMFVEECLHGVQQSGKTVLPQQIGSAATFDHDILYAVGAAIGKEARAYGIVQCFAPVIGTARDPRWGRVEETFGESTRLTAELTTQWVLGAQGGAPDGTTLNRTTSIIAEPKHYIAHSNPESGTNAAPVHIGQRELLMYFAPQFEWAVKYGGARGIMAAYHSMDGVPSCANRYTLTELLRDEWGFQGWVLADDGAVHMMFDTHRTASDPSDAINQFLTAGGNVPYYDFPHDVYTGAIVASIANGSLSESVLDDRVADLIRVKMELGLFDEPMVDPALIQTNVDTPEHAQLALDAARASIVLLQNKAWAGVSTVGGAGGAPSTSSDSAAASAAGPVLPLSLLGVRRIAVIGPSADVMRLGDYSGGGIHSRYVTVLQGIQAAAAAAGTGVIVDFELGVQVASPTEVIGGKPFGLELVPIPPYRYRTTDGTTQGVIGSYWAPGTPHTSQPDFIRLDDDISFEMYAYGPAAYVRHAPISGALFPDTKFFAIWEGFFSPPVTADAISIGVAAGGTATAWTLFINGSAVQTRGAPPALLNVTAGTLVPFRLEFTRDADCESVMLAWSLLPLGSVSHNEDAGIAAAMALAAGSDVVVVVGGEADGSATNGMQTVGEGVDVNTLDLPGRQEELILALANTGTPIVVVLLHGRPLTIPRIVDAVPAILSAWFPGQAGGRAIADVLFGAVNPAGRTPMTWPRDVGQLPCYFDYEPSARKGYVYESNAPLFPFGHGLSYTTFHYSNLVISPGVISPVGPVNVSISVRNNGTVEGDEVVQLYVRDVVASIATPIKQLKGFVRIHNVQPSESRTVTFSLYPQRDLWVMNRNYTRVVEPGNFTVALASSSADADVQLAGWFLVQ